jgi:hypothetical protein
MIKMIKINTTGPNLEFNAYLDLHLKPGSQIALHSLNFDICENSDLDDIYGYCDIDKYIVQVGGARIESYESNDSGTRQKNMLMSIQRPKEPHVSFQTFSPIFIDFAGTFLENLNIRILDSNYKSVYIPDKSKADIVILIREPNYQ